MDMKSFNNATPVQRADAVEDAETHAPSGGAAVILATHYSEVRSNIVSLTERMDRYLFVAFSAMGVIFSVALQEWQKPDILIVIPAVAFVAALLYVSLDLQVGLMAKHLKDEYSADLNKYLGLDPVHWDKTHTGDVFFGKNLLSRRASTLGIMFALAGLGAYAMWIDTKMEEGVFIFPSTTSIGDFISVGALQNLVVNSNYVMLIISAFYIFFSLAAWRIMAYSSKRRRQIHYFDLSGAQGGKGGKRR